MGFNRARIKENAKTHYSINKWNNVLTVLISSLVSGGISVVVSSMSNAMLVGSSIISTVVSIFFTNILLMGAVTWFQKAIHAEKLDIAEMSAPFKNNYTDNVLMLFLKNLFITLWSLLFVVPGIVKAYSYSMAEYIKAENPSISANDAIDISKKITDGHKADLFILDLSFIGWFLLSGCTFGILFIVYVGPYYLAAKAFAYEEIKAEAIASGKIDASIFTSSAAM